MKQQGFTLLELMITVGIIGILASIATSVYTQNVIAANRTDGRAAILESSVILEKCKAIYGTYTNNCSITGVSIIPSKEGLYSITATLTATSFTLTATPQGNQVADTSCQTMTLTHLGVQSGTGNDSSACW